MKRIKGIIPPLITPLLDRDRLDIEGLDRLVDHVIAGGVSGLFILGTTGEAPSLSYRLRREVIQRVCTQTKDRVPVLVAITDTAFVESVNLAKFAAGAGASALVVSTPYYFPAGQTELIEYVSHLVAELPLPLMLYNMPSLTKVQFEIDSLKTLSDLKGIVGVKDSSGDLEYFERLVQLRLIREDWSFYMGPEHLMIPAVQMGGQGGVNGGANVFPGLFVQACQAASLGDDGRMKVCQEKIDALQAIYHVGKYASRYIKATKCAASILGLCNDFMAEPFHRFKKPEREKVEALLAGLGMETWDDKE